MRIGLQFGARLVAAGRAEPDSLPDQLFGGEPQPAILLLREDLALQQLASEVVNGVARAPSLFLRLAAVAKPTPGQVARMMEIAIGQCLDDERMCSPSQGGCRLFHRCCHRHRIHSVHNPSGHVIGSGAL